MKYTKLLSVNGRTHLTGKVLVDKLKQLLPRETYSRLSDYRGTVKHLQREVRVSGQTTWTARPGDKL